MRSPASLTAIAPMNVPSCHAPFWSSRRVWPRASSVASTARTNGEMRAHGVRWMRTGPLAPCIAPPKSQSVSSLRKYGRQASQFQPWAPCACHSS